MPDAEEILCPARWPAGLPRQLGRPDGQSGLALIKSWASQGWVHRVTETRAGAERNVCYLTQDARRALDFVRGMRRGDGYGLPVMLLTALGEEDDRIAGLEAGADDYLTKPFSPRELALRVRSVLRRVPARDLAGPLEITNGALQVSTSAHSVSIDGVAVSLTNREFDLLVFLLTHPGTVYSRDQLLKLVWQWD